MCLRHTHTTIVFTPIQVKIFQQHLHSALCTLYNTDRHRMVFVTFFTHLLSGALCLAPSQFVFASRSLPSINRCANTHAYISLSRPNRKLKGLRFDVVKVQKVLFASICFGFLSLLNYALFLPLLEQFCYDTVDTVRCYRSTFRYMLDTH